MMALLTFISLPSLADSTNFYLSAQGGISRIHVADDVLLSTVDKASSTYGAYGAFGFRTPFHLILEAGGGYAENLDALGSTFDNYELSELRVSIGWSIPLGSHFRLVPKVGRYR